MIRTVVLTLLLLAWGVLFATPPVWQLLRRRSGLAGAVGSAEEEPAA